MSRSSRRKFFMQTGAMLGSAILGDILVPEAFALPLSNHSPEVPAIDIGSWLQSDNGLPFYQYKGPVPFYGVDKKGADALLPDDPFFILGNYRCTLFAHASGIIQFLTGERAWARINAAEQINYGSNTAKLSITQKSAKKTVDLVGIPSLGTDSSVTKRYFGTGFARYEYRPGNDMECTRILSVKPSDAIHSGSPAVVITILLKNNGAEKIEVEYEEKIAMNYIPVNLQRKEKTKRAVLYKNETTVDSKQQTALCSVSYSADSFLTEHKKEDSNFYDIHPVSVFMQAPRQVGSGIRVHSTPGVEEALCAAIDTFLLPGESKRYTIVVGLTYEKNFSVIEKQVKDLLTLAGIDNSLEGLFIDLWKKKLPDLSAETNDVFKREMLWNAYTLECMATYSDYFKETYVPQGMLYTYQDGENISNRDHAQAMLPLCYTNPALAKSALRYVIRHTTHTGEITRGSGGFGYIEPSIYKESDEQLYLFQSIAEYLRITKDYGLLNETVNYYPAEYEKKDTIINLLKKHFVYLRDVVGRGRNGLIKILNSDWSDSFFHKYSPNLYAGSAESVLNTTMALAVLPNFLSTLKKASDKGFAPFITAIESYHKQVLEAFLADFGNRNFAARCYLNSGKGEKFGIDDVCIEPQGYLLQIPGLSKERKKMIYEKVKAATLSPEKVGFRTREVPMWGGAGEGEDGGIWFSLEGSVVAGVITFDKKEAWALLEKMSFDNYSRQYPEYWVGRWTFPDFINSTLSAREGLYTFWEPKLKNAFKAFCSHPHSWPLYCYFRLKEPDL